MSSIVVAGDTSGSITLLAPTVAGSGTLTLPIATDTLVGKATTDTLTNKTLTAPVMTAPVLGTPTSGNLVNCTFPTLNQDTSGSAGSVAYSGLTGTVPTWNQNTSGSAGSVAYSGLTGTVPTWNQDTSGSAATAATVTTNANLTGVITSVGNATSIASQTGTGSKFVVDTSPVLNTVTVSGYTETVVAIGVVTTAATLAISAGTVLTATLTASTACVFTMPAVGAGKSFTLLLKQAAATGNGTATFTGVKFPTTPVITAALGKMDILSFVSDGTSWYGSAVQGYTA
jgi:hypothetical protein